MADIVVDAARFHERIIRLRDHWQSSVEAWDNVDAVCIPMGATSDTDAVYSKSASVHMYLFGVEFPDSIILITKNSFFFMAAAKKCSYLQPVAATVAPGNLKMSLLTKTKEESLNREHFQTLLQAAKTSGRRLGTIINKVPFNGEFIPSWTSYIEAGRMEVVDISAGLGLMLSMKDETELVRLY
jgi:nucleosome binding factor SPN SPT16 subunit